MSPLISFSDCCCFLHFSGYTFLSVWCCFSPLSFFPLGQSAPSAVQQFLVGFCVKWGGKHFLCRFFGSSVCHLAMSAIVQGSFSPCPSAATSCVFPSWSALLLPLFLAVPQKSISPFMSLPFKPKGTVVLCCGDVPLDFHQWGFLSNPSKCYNGAPKAWMAIAECTLLEGSLILFSRSQ